MGGSDDSGTTAPGLSAHAALRAGTAELHEAVEAGMDLTGRLASPASYRELLRRFLGILEPLEAELATFSWPDALAMDVRRKAALLKADLAHLDAERDDALPPPRLSPVPLPSQAAAYGCLYVLEGSTLGGRVILKEVQARLGFDGERGASFFAGYGKQTAEMWTTFLRVLAENVRGADAIEQALGGARETFAALDRSITCPPGLRAA